MTIYADVESAWSPHPDRPVDQKMVDVTEAVQVLYDIVHGSMNMGSGMLSTEELEAVLAIVEVMGWEPPDISGHGVAVAGELALRYPHMYEIVVRKQYDDRYYEKFPQAQVNWRTAIVVKKEPKS